MMSKSLSISLALNPGMGLQKEFIRKSIHLLIASIPFMASINLSITIGLLTAGTLIYSYSETLRCSGSPVFLISNITIIAARERDRNRFVLGPVTLGLGALLTLLLYPSPAAAIGIYALAFGDGLSSIFGKLYGKKVIPHSGGKTFVGSLTCFSAVLLTTYSVSGDILKSLCIALVATLIEVLPIKDFDNLFIPVGTAAFSQIIL
jgi:dolichol kinase